MQTIYTPKGRAYEYAPLALNIYSGCSHGCKYCYMRPMVERFKGKGSFDTPVYRDGLKEALWNKLFYDATTLLAPGEEHRFVGKTIHLCFSCDPYPAGIDTTPTRDVIQLLKQAGCHVQILTKGGSKAARDFDLLDGEDWFGVTYSGYGSIKDCAEGCAEEPNAAPAAERLWLLRKAKSLGIKTWVSCEPVLNDVDVHGLIKKVEYIDLFRIGKLNYRPSDINWAVFGRECERLAKLYGRNILIKQGLREEMDKG